MGLRDRIEDDFKKAFVGRDELRLSTLRMLKAAITNREIEKRKKEEGLNEEELIEVISSELKKRKDAETQYLRGGRAELAEKEKKEGEVLISFMPEALPEEEIRRLVEDAILRIGAQNLSEMGKVMGVLMPHVKGRADGELVSRIVKELLANKPIVEE